MVEGWTPDYVLEEAVAEYKRGRYQKLYVTGGPIEAGAPLAEYRTYAERGAAVVLKLGLDAGDVQTVPAPPVRQDRTYAAMVALGQWFERHGSMPAKVHLVTRGPHARRSRALLRHAFGEQVNVGVTAVPIREYDAAHWWRSSAGVRDVVGEALAYSYVLWFAPEAEPAASP